VFTVEVMGCCRKLGTSRIHIVHVRISFNPEPAQYHKLGLE